MKHDKGHKILLKDVLIDYSQNWHKQHIGALQAAYGKSAYFEYIFPLFFQVFEKKSKFPAPKFFSNYFFSKEGLFTRGRSFLLRLCSRIFHDKNLVMLVQRN